MLSGQSALLVSDYMLMNASTLNVTLSQFQLIKMTVIAHGRHLACTDKPLIIDRIEAWKHGPVIPVLYHELKIYGDNPIQSLRYCGTPTFQSTSRESLFNDVLSDTERNIINGVIKEYGDWTISELYQLFHEKGSPWSQCYTGERGVEIPDSIIRAYYKSEMVAAVQ